MIKIAVCEDEKNLYKHLEECIKEYIRQNNLVVTVEWFLSAEEFLKCYAMQYDIVFMDIKMNGMNGIEATKLLREKDNRIAIVFLTAYTDFALESYSVDASDYIVKPVSCEKVKRAFRKALGSIERRERAFVLQYKGNIRKILIMDILYIEAYRHKRYYHLIDGTVEEDIGTLKEILDQDIKKEFLLIQRGCIVNKFWIDKCQNQIVHVRGYEKDLAASRLRWKEIEKEYLLYCMTKIQEI